jgi:hypothetical protein
MPIKAQGPDHGRVIQSIANAQDQMKIQTGQRLKKMAEAQRQFMGRLDVIELALSEGGVPIETHGLQTDEVLGHITNVVKRLDDLTMEFTELQTVVTGLEAAQEENAVAIEEKLNGLQSAVDEWEEDE